MRWNHVGDKRRLIELGTQSGLVRREAARLISKLATERALRNKHWANMIHRWHDKLRHWHEVTTLDTEHGARYDELHQTHSALLDDHAVVRDENMSLKWRHVYMQNKQANFFDMVSVMEAKAYAKAAQFARAASQGQETLKQIDIISSDSGNQHRRIQDLEKSLRIMEQKVASCNSLRNLLLTPLSPSAISTPAPLILCSLCRRLSLVTPSVRSPPNSKRQNRKPIRRRRS